MSLWTEIFITMEKYLIASSGDTFDSKLSGRFGHSNYFLITDPKTLEFEVFSGIQDDESAQGIRGLISRDIKKVIVGNIGPSSFYEITSLGCEVYLCRNMMVSEAIKQVMNGNIQPLKEPTLPDSIHSARKADDRDKGTGRGRGMGLGSGMGMGGGRGGGRGRRG
ncbi:MAG: NifB/NifX family molybdenum-iron cluster-binding protein [Bacteroidales bacterium]|nr:NifB/NifX family molybdenum-iron cluster-binding protein [Bacteroidales bacterium]